MRMSSANKRWVIRGPCAVVRIPNRSSLFWFWLIRRESNSEQRINRYGDKGQPCWKPQVASIQLDFWPFIIKANLGASTQAKAHLLQVSGKPKC
ncbi:hypothetical protein AXF42_Ash013358 [Apostasia shenzhenica]|uniref:Uncharacterized protein n=1 Tax=Apostasia shenzhenica TaxID=1088818 RepID=A0A2I0BBR9_9ASPA|nr:hypothetical protein AXF42_Ash013358 [Apostasia shenzhenica]